MKFRKYLVLISLGMLLSLSIREESPPAYILSPPTPPTLPAPSLNLDVSKKPIHNAQIAQKKRNSKLSEKFLFSILEKQIRSHRSQLAYCILNNKDLAATQIKMTLFWEGSGMLRDLKLEPDPGESVKSCIREILLGWKLKSHPGLQPFSYQVVLRPSGF